MDRLDPIDRPVLVLDFGSQYVQLIARRVREQQAFARIVRHDITAERVRAINPLAIILSGGPSSVYEAGAPRCDPRLFELGIPVLAICYGMQLACEALGGKVEPAPAREYGRAECHVTDPSDPLFAGVPASSPVWMSHGDQVHAAGDAFTPVAATATCPVAAVRHRSLPVYGSSSTPRSRTRRTGRRSWATSSTQGLPEPRGLDDGGLPRPRRSSRSPSAGWARRAGRLRALGRGRLGGLRRAPGQGARLPGGLRLRRQRPAPGWRAGGGGRGLRPPLRRPS